MIQSQLHASAVEIDGCAVLILGDSGAGKSALALELLAMGANLVGDDQVFLSEKDETLVVEPHPNAKGRFEIRNVGIFKTLATKAAEVIAVVNLNQAPTSRLPERRYFESGNIKIYQYDIKGLSHMAAFIYLLLTHKIEVDHI